MRIFLLFIVLFVLWALLTYPPGSQDLIAGFVVSAIVSVFLGRLYRNEPRQIINPKRWFWFLVYLPYFLYCCVRANLDVMYRVLHPDLPIRPGIVRIRTELKTDLAKTFLANSITLTPGTLSVDVQGQDLFVHWINVTTDDPAEQKRAIVRKFERILKEVFE